MFRSPVWDQKVGGNGWVVAQQADTDRTSQWENDCHVAVTYLNLSVCVSGGDVGVWVLV